MKNELHESEQWSQILLKSILDTGPWSDTDGLMHGLMKFVSLLVEWSKRVNLVSYRSTADLVYDHVLDSLWGLRAVFDVSGLACGGGGPRFVDVGSGAGFPGLVYGLASGWKGTLIESRRKRSDFLTECIETLELTNLTVLNERAEIVGRDPKHRERYDVVAARAVGSVATLVELCGPLVRCGGVVELFKGPRLEAELKDAHRAASEMGLTYKETLHRNLGPERKTRCYAFFAKETPTPEKYPRRPGLPRKRPI